MNTCSVIRSSRPAGLFSFGLLDGPHVHLRPPYVRETPAGFSRERLATACMNNPGYAPQSLTNTQGDFQGDVLVDSFIHQDGEQFRVLNDSGATVPGPVHTRSGLEIREIDGGVTTGPARMIRVSLRPMEVQILAR